MESVVRQQATRSERIRNFCCYGKAQLDTKSAGCLSLGYCRFPLSAKINVAKTVDSVGVTDIPLPSPRLTITMLHLAIGSQSKPILESRQENSPPSDHLLAQLSVSLVALETRVKQKKHNIQRGGGFALHIVVQARAYLCFRSATSDSCACVMDSSSALHCFSTGTYSSVAITCPVARWPTITPEIYCTVYVLSSDLEDVPRGHVQHNLLHRKRHKYAGAGLQTNSDSHLLGGLQLRPSLLPPAREFSF